VSYTGVSHRLAVIAGSIFVVSPLLVELVHGEFFLLVPIALLLAVIALPGLWRARHVSRLKLVAVCASVVALVVAFATETYEQSLPQPIPTWVDILAPAAIVATGVCLVAAGWQRPATAEPQDAVPSAKTSR
jgi:hypothetical protein